MKINAPVIHYALAIAGLKGISLLMLPIVTRFLSPESYGELNFLVSIGAMLSIFLGFGMAEMMFQFTAIDNLARVALLIKTFDDVEVGFGQAHDLTDINLFGGLR